LTLQLDNKLKIRPSDESMLKNLKFVTKISNNKSITINDLNFFSTMISK